MTSTSDSTNATTGDRSRDGRRNGRRCGGSWSGLNIAAMVVGFVLFWPIGLFVLFWILSGRGVQELPDAVRGLWSRVEDALRGNGSDSRATTENSVFNEFQQAQYERIRDIKDEIKERARRFRDFRANAKRRVDEEEFNQFMSDAPAKDQT
jgi:hypothetical protein